MSIALQISLLAAGLLLLFAAAFLFSRRINNFGCVDVLWAFAFTPATLGLALVSTGALQRRLLLASLVAVWSLRLGGHLFRRVSALHPVEDGRYASLRQSWAASLNRSMFFFFMAQALLVVLLCALLLPSLNDSSEAFRISELVAAALLLLSVLGEATADSQLRRFKHQPANTGRVCELGLWSLSRHPNYFFEWLVWLSLALFCLGSPWGWLALFSPLLMYHFLYRVTGIPYTESQLLKSKGEAYKDYQRRVPAFYPFKFARSSKPSLP